MKKTLDNKYEYGRIRKGPLASTSNYGTMGAFELNGPSRQSLFIISSGPNNKNWEHVSVSLPKKNRTPNWQEMCFVKDIFWDEEECVIQYHPPKSKYINNHPYVLHLWKPIGIELPMPPETLIGLKDLNIKK